MLQSKLKSYNKSIHVSPCQRWTRNTQCCYVNKCKGKHSNYHDNIDVYII